MMPLLVGFCRSDLFLTVRLPARRRSETHGAGSHPSRSIAAGKWSAARVARQYRRGRLADDAPLSRDRRNSQAAPHHPETERAVRGQARLMALSDRRTDTIKGAVIAAAL